MNICVICGEKYEDGMKNCPICGCQKYTISQLGFPEMLEEQYVPAEMTIGSGRRRYVSLINKETGEAILAGRFLPEEIQLQDLVEKQERESAPELPEVFKTIRNTSGMIFFFEKVPGVTLGELAQQEYPLNEENIFHVMDFTRQQLKQLSKRGFFLGQTDLYSCGITETGIRLRDFGGDNFSEVGKELAEEKFLPLLSQKSESEKLRITGILVAVTAVLAMIVVIQLFILFGYFT